MSPTETNPGNTDSRPVSFRWGIATDVGKRRAVNEDGHLVEPGLFVVADGMGGHEAGDVASRLAVLACRPLADRLPLSQGALEAMIDDANRAVRSHADEHGSVGMGTTLVGATTVDNGGATDVFVFNVGDSRCYELTEVGGLRLLTRDHSVVQELVDSGSLSQEQARSHHERHVVTRAIGIAEQVVADFAVLERRSSTRLLLCSDGVTSELDEATLESVLRAAPGPQEAADAIIEAFRETPARDNATALVVDIERADILDDEVVMNNDTTEPRVQTAASPRTTA